MKKIFITLLGLASVLGGMALATPDKKHMEAPVTTVNINDGTISGASSKQAQANLWLPEGFSWGNKHHSIINKFKPHEVVTMSLNETDQGIYMGIMAGRTPVGYIFSFYNDKLVGVCVAYETGYPKIPQIENITTEEGYTRTYRSQQGRCHTFDCKQGDWVFIESGLKGYKIFTWLENLGIAPPQ